MDVSEKKAPFLENSSQIEKICPIRDIWAHLSDKWSMLVVISLGTQGRMRFNELKDYIQGISQKMLTVTLRSLERDGLIVRELYPQIPPRVEYELTDLGKSLMNQMKVLTSWAFENVDSIVEARKRYDKLEGS